jgi:OOP family OmpA-OmpF porin
MQQGHYRRGVPLMPTHQNTGAACLRSVVAALSALFVFAASTGAGHAQATLTTGNLVDGLVGLETTPNIDVAAMRRVALERIKREGGQSAVNRPPVAEMLYNLPQLTVEIQFNLNSAVINPVSYPTLGRIADALYHPVLSGYRILVVGHTDATGRREYNLALSEKRAAAIHGALVSTFRVPPQRVLSVGLGEEQLQDRGHPEAAVNRRVQIVTIGKVR